MNLSESLFLLSKFTAVIVVTIKVITALIGEYFGAREVMLLISLVLLLLITNLYQYKRQLYSPGYILYYLVFFFALNFSAYNYIHNPYIALKIEHATVAIYPSDHYQLYFTIFTLVSIIIYSYLHVLTRLNNTLLVFKGVFNAHESLNVLFGGILILPISLFGAKSFRIIMVFFVVYFILQYALYRKARLNIVVNIGIIISALVLFSIITIRFTLLQYLLPIILGVVVVYTMKGYQIRSKLRLFLLSVFGFLAVMFYGIASEIVKLNLYWGASLTFDDFINTMTNYDLFMMGVNSQIFRIIDIWTILGGNIIELVDRTDFFYGITYVKSLAYILDFDYVSLPLISAKFIGASYAQPGLLAEGYANFGIVGAIMNILSVFFMAELLFDYFMRKQSMFFLILLVGCFSQVLLDGGTMNSVLFMAFFCCLTFSANYFSKSLLRK